jgi:hypothetical protein
VWASNSVEDGAKTYVCASCGMEWRFLQCGGCKTPSIVAKGDDFRWKCPRCPRVNGYLGSWSTAAAAGAEGGLVAHRQPDPARVWGSVIAAAGFPPLAAGIGCRVEFGSDDVIIWAVMASMDDQQIATVTYAETGFLRIGGRGAMTSTRGGGWFGGGFGPVGMAEGVLFATAMNALTRRTMTSVETIVHLNAGVRELMFLSSQETPEVLQVRLAPVFNRLGDVKQRALSKATQTADPVQTDGAARRPPRQGPAVNGGVRGGKAVGAEVHHGVTP